MVDHDGPAYRVSSYTVYPTGYDRVAAAERQFWCLRVEDAGDGWAIRWRSRCMNFRGDLEFEPPRRSRTPDFLRRCRFTEHAALHRARLAVDELLVDGLTFDEFVDQVKRESTQKAREVVHTRRSKKAAVVHRALTRLRSAQSPANEAGVPRQGRTASHVG